MSGFLSRSEETRDVKANGSRFWITDPNGVLPFGDATVGIVDENEGGIVLYTHADNAEATIAAFRVSTPRRHEMSTFQLDSNYALRDLDGSSEEQFKRAEHALRVLDLMHGSAAL